MSQNLQNFVKFQKFQFENLVDFEKCCKTHILNYFLAKIGADTAENEQHFAEILPLRGCDRVHAAMLHALRLTRAQRRRWSGASLRHR